jgi:hypothetical protein
VIASHYDLKTVRQPFLTHDHMITECTVHGTLTLPTLKPERNPHHAASNFPNVFRIHHDFNCLGNNRFCGRLMAAVAR